MSGTTASSYPTAYLAYITHTHGHVRSYGNLDESRQLRTKSLRRDLDVCADTDPDPRFSAKYGSGLEQGHKTSGSLLQLEPWSPPSLVEEGVDTYLLVQSRRKAYICTFLYSLGGRHIYAPSFTVLEEGATGKHPELTNQPHPPSSDTPSPSTPHYY